MSIPQYPTYMNPGAQWLDRVPSHWRSGSLRWLSKRFSGGTPDKNIHAYWEDGTIPWLNSGAVNQALITEPSTLISVSGFENSSAKWIPGGALVMALAGQGKTKGMVAQLGIPSTCNQSMAAIVPTSEMKPRFLLWWLQSNYQNIRNMAGGDMRDGLNLDLLGEIPCPIPPLREQSGIASFLDHETTRIDALVAEQLRLIELLKEKRQAVISLVVTKGMNPFAPSKNSGVKWLGKIPAHWEVGQSRRLFAVRSEAALPGDKMLTASQKYGVLYQKDYVEIEGRRVVEVIMGLESLKHVEPDDFIISMRSFQGGIEWCKLRGSTSFHYVMLRPVKGVHPPFFAHLFKSNVYIQALRATTDLIRDGQELRYSNFVQVDLPIIPMDEQIRMATYLDREVSKLDELAKEAANVIAILQERRSALISAAVTGKIDVRGLAAQPEAVVA